MGKHFLIVDLEATCSDDDSILPEEMEIIEIGARWTTEDGVVLERFQHLVRPLVRPPSPMGASRDKDTLRRSS